MHHKQSHIKQRNLDINKEELQRVLNPETFLEEAFARLKAEYSWITKEDLDPTLHFEIEKIDNQYKYRFCHIHNDGTLEELYSPTFELEEDNGVFKLVYRYISIITHDEQCIEFNSDEICDSIYRKQKTHILKSDRAKFPYGHDIHVYFELALKSLKSDFPWATEKDLNPEYRYQIERVENNYEYIKYIIQKDGSETRCILSDEKGMSPNAFIKQLISHHRWYLLEHNEVIEECSIQPPQSTEPNGWHIERYVIQKRKRGDYTLLVQAGDRNTGGFLNPTIPASCFETDSFETFIDRYLKAMPDFGVTKEALSHHSKLKAFLGYK